MYNENTDIHRHNNLPWNLYQIVKNDLGQFDFRSNLSQNANWVSIKTSQTDLPRLKKGMLGGQVSGDYHTTRNDHQL